MLDALIIYPDSTFTFGPTDTSLKGLQTVVGGWIEAVNTPAGASFIVNDEGKLTGMEANEIATLLWWSLHPDVAGLDYLCGPVVVLGPVDANGDETSVTSDTLQTFATVVCAAAVDKS